MKQIWPDYSYSPATNVLTLTGLNIDRDQLLLVTAADRGRIMYNFADSSVTASAFTSGANTALTLVATTAGLTTTAALVIYYDDQLQSTAITISNFPSSQVISGTVTANPTGTQTIAGTVTANIGGIANSVTLPVRLIAERTGGAPTGEDTLLTCNSSGMLLIDAQSAGTSVLGFDGNAFVQVKPVSGSSVTIGNSVTIGSLPAISGTVTANGGDGTFLVGGLRSGGKTALQLDTATGYLQTKVESLPSLVAGTAQIGSVTASISGTVPVSISSVTIGNPVTISSLPALVAGTAQIGSVTASISNSVTIASLPAISGTVTANTFALQGTAVTTSDFTSTTASTVLAGFNATREVLTIFNEGAGNLHICAGATCTTIAYQVRLSAGDYYEVPNHQTTITHSAVFATAGTARVTQIS